VVKLSPVFIKVGAPDVYIQIYKFEVLKDNFHTQVQQKLITISRQLENTEEAIKKDNPEKLAT
jgi:hypothetical protein